MGDSVSTSSVIQKHFPRGVHSFFGFSQLEVGQFMHNAMCAGNVLIPADAVIAQIIGGSGIAQALIEHIGQHAGFAHVRIVGRPEGEIVRGVGVVFLRRDIIRLASDPLIKAAGAAPDRR